MTSHSEEAILQEIAETQKRQRDLSTAIKSKAKLQKVECEGVSALKPQVDTVAELLQKFGATSDACSEIGFPDQLAQHAPTLLLILELSSSDVVVSYALGQGRTHREDMSAGQLWDVDLRSGVAAGIEWLYILAPEEVTASLLEQDEKLMYRLGRYVVEHQLFHWTIKQNCESGVSPKNRQLKTQAARSIPTTLPAKIQTQLRNFFLNDDRTSRYWVHSFCKRWKVKPRSRLQAGENMDSKLVETKVSWL